MTDDRETSAERARRMAEIRGQIADGTYETPGKLALAVEAFFDSQQPAGPPQLRIFWPEDVQPEAGDAT